MLELCNLGRRFGSRWAVSGLSVTFSPGQLVGLLGPNGAGKTTCLKLLAGILEPSTGYARVGGIDLVAEPEQAKAQLAYLPDRPYIPERLSARELLRYVAGLYRLPPSVVTERGLPELARFGLAGREDDLLSTYSHGMRQRALLASAFMRAPRVFLIDEPMVGLDAEGARLVKRTLQEAVEAGAVVLMSTHTLPVVEEICHRVLLMSGGRIIADGTVQELLARVPVVSDGLEPTLEDMIIALTQEQGAPEQGAQEQADGRG